MSYDLNNGDSDFDSSGIPQHETFTAESAFYTYKNDCYYEDICPLRGFYNSIFQDIPLGLLVIDHHQKIMFFNHFMEKLTGLNAEQIIGNYYPNTFNSGTLNILQKIINISNKSNKKLQNHELKHANGHVYSVSVYKTDNPQPEEIIITIQDFTQFKKVEKRTIESEKNIIKSQIVNEVFHELRNILSSIQANSQLLKTKIAGQQQGDLLKYINNILSQLDYINQMSRDFLNLTHPSKTTPTQVTQEQIIEEIHLLFMEELAPRKIKFVVNYDSSLPPLNIDLFQLKQVLINIIKNAIEAIEQNGIIIIRTRFTPPDYFKIFISDNGCGLDQKTLKNIFQPFFTTKEKGTGLGLAISKRIINNLQGSINIKSKKDKGTTFILKLPVRYQK